MSLQITRQTISPLRDRIEKALEALGTELGVQFKAGSASFVPPNVAKFQLHVSTIGDGGVVETEERVAFRQNAILYGLKAEDLDREFEAGGKTYAISGLLRRSRTMPILGKRKPDGKEFKFSLSVVKSGLKPKA